MTTQLIIKINNDLQKWLVFAIMAFNITTVNGVMAVTCTIVYRILFTIESGNNIWI